MTSTLLRLRHSGMSTTPSWRSLLPPTNSSSSSRPTSPLMTTNLTLCRTRRAMSSFKPRRTPPPSLAGINIQPRPNPLPSSSTTTTTTTTVKSQSSQQKSSSSIGGQGRKPNWISPHHKDYYSRIDNSTINHPQLLHGDPHMPIQKLTRGDGKVVLTSNKKRAIELNDYTKMMGGGALDAFDNGDGEDDGDDIDELEREFGSDAADAIRHHLNSFNHRINSAKDIGSTVGKGTSNRDGDNSSSYYSPLDEIEERFRTIDRMTSAKGSTQDLALLRRARTESRDFYRLGSIPRLTNGSSGDELVGDDDGRAGSGDDDANDFDKEFGHGRGYDATSVFGKSATVKYPYGRDLPSPTYHPDFPTGSNVGNNPNDPDEEAWVQELNKLIYEEKYTDMELGDIDETYTPSGIQKEDMEKYMAEKDRTKKFNLLEREEEHEKVREEKLDELLEMIKNGEDPNQEAFGPWGDMTVKVDRVQKVERGGTTVRYRALVIGGNGNGAAGFGIGKALAPNEAIVKACKHCKRNVFYIDRYLNSGLSYDLAGRHNSCKVRLRAVSPDYGLHGHPLITEILKYAGISDATSKSHGNRNPYNVVYATFKALMTHESLEEIAMKRGKKLLNLQRARRLGI